MGAPTKAVFMSYASQDAEVARRLCEALRAVGLDVWFDQSELRGGDVWDASIRRQIKECALFVPVISANTQAREEGYFRLEWKLAVDRSHLMADDRAFLLPVVIDATIDANARVPEKFREVQWTHLPGNQRAVGEILGVFGITAICFFGLIRAHPTAHALSLCPHFRITGTRCFLHIHRNSLNVPPGDLSAILMAHPLLSKSLY